MQTYFFNKANEKFNQGLYEQAINYYSMGINCKHINIHNIYLIRDAYLKLCQCYWQLGDYEFARYYNSFALNIDPNNEYAISNLKLFPTHEKLNIVMIAPNNNVPIPPEKYGGIERVVFDLTEELVNQGHNVYLFADKRSTTSAKLIEYDSNMTTSEFILDNFPYNENINIVHDHSTEFKNFVVTNNVDFGCPFVYTYHFHDIHTGYLNKDCNVIFPTFESENNEVKTKVVIHHGLNMNDYVSYDKEDYLLFIGSIYKEKGVHTAIEIAKKTNSKLKIAGPVFPENKDYFENIIKPNLNDKIEYIGDVGGEYRQELFGKAKAMLFPIEHQESFGLVMIEALASGTPVVAYDISTVNEIIGCFANCVGKTEDDLINIINTGNFPTQDELIYYCKSNFSRELMVQHHIEYYKCLMEERL